jgi:predicted TIM-barrel fold metal-dependent hydrolase
MIVDCHAHIVSDDLERYPPAPLSGRVRAGDLDDPITAERLLELMDAAGVERAVLVQRAHVYGFDNAYVADAAERYPERLRAVCAIDAENPSSARQIRHWVTERGAIGIRLTEPYRGADTSWFASEHALAAWEMAAELGVPVRLHFYRWNRAACLPAVAHLVRRFPQTTVVIDHLSNLSAEEGPPDYGLDAPLRSLAASPNLFLLFSTINLANLAEARAPAAPVITHLVRTFGAHRIMWGSDIGQSKGTYAQMLGSADAAVAALADDERRQLLADTGRAVYGDGSLVRRGE